MTGSEGDGEDGKHSTPVDQVPSHKFGIASEGVDRQITERFAGTFRLAHEVLTAVPQFASVPQTTVQAIITADFVATVQRVLDEIGDPNQNYGTERLGGLAVAKAIRTADDFSAHTVVFDADLWAADTLAVSPFGLELASHEMAHVMLGRARWVSGALEGVEFPTVTPIEVARSAVRTAVEEYRADMIAGTVLGSAVSIAQDGKTRPARPGDFIGDNSYRDQLAVVLDTTVYPGWPDTVQRYRTRHLTLEQMWTQIAESTDQVLTLLGHCEAESHFGDERGAFKATTAAHRGAELYVRPMWSPIMEAVEAQGLPELVDTKTAELELLDVGEAAVLGMWERLGWDVEVQQDGRFAIWVSAPER